MEKTDLSYTRFLEFCKNGKYNCIEWLTLFAEVYSIVNKRISANQDGIIVKGELEKLQSMYNKVSHEICTWSNDCAEIQLNRLNNIFAHFARLNDARIIKSCDARARYKFELLSLALVGSGNQDIISVIISYYVLI